jgi:phosphatidylglycerol:prolipoprotein diacylglycerol transferase
MFVHDISPILFSVGPFSIRYYSLLFACAFLLGLYLINRVFEIKKMDTNLVQPLFITIFVCVIVGARLGHVLFYRPHYFFRHPLEIFMVWRGGLASHGAAIAILLGVIIFARRHKMPFYRLADALVIPVSIGTSFIRLGNFFNSEIVGRVTSVPWAVKFLRYPEPGGGPPQWRHPSQLYEMTMGIVLFVTLWTLLKKKGDTLRDGFLLYLCLFMYFSMRFAVEFVKEYPFIVRGIPLTTGQYLSIPFILFSGFMLFVAGRNRAGRAISAPAAGALKSR